MVGYALTATADSTTPGDTRTSRVDEVVSQIEAAPEPVVFVVQHVGHDRTRCCLFGDMFCTVLSKLGGVGIVTDATSATAAPSASERPTCTRLPPAWWSRTATRCTSSSA